MANGQPDKLRFEQVLDVAFRLNDTAFSYWQFFVVGMIAVVGWRFSVDIELNLFRKFILTVVLFGGTILSAMAMGRVYKTLKATLEELKVMSRTIDFQTATPKQIIENAGILNLRVVYGIHVAAAVILIALVWLPWG